MSKMFKDVYPQLSVKKVKVKRQMKAKKPITPNPNYPGIYEFMDSFDDELPTLSESNSAMRRLGEQIRKGFDSSHSDSSNSPEHIVPATKLVQLGGNTNNGNDVLFDQPVPILEASENSVGKSLDECTLMSSEMRKEALRISKYIYLKGLEEQYERFKQELDEYERQEHQLLENISEMGVLQSQTVELRQRLQTCLAQIEGTDTKKRDKISDEIELKKDAATQTKSEIHTKTQMCACGLQSAKCCEMRSQLLEGIQLLYVKYPHFQKELGKLLREHQQEKLVMANEELPQIVEKKEKKANKKHLGIQRQQGSLALEIEKIVKERSRSRQTKTQQKQQPQVIEKDDQVMQEAPQTEQENFVQTLIKQGLQEEVKKWVKEFLTTEQRQVQEVAKEQQQQKQAQQVTKEHSPNRKQKMLKNAPKDSLAEQKQQQQLLSKRITKKVSPSRNELTKFVKEFKLAEQRVIDGERPTCSKYVKPQRQTGGCNKETARNTSVESKRGKKQKSALKRDEKKSHEQDKKKKMSSPGPTMAEEIAKYVNSIVEDYLGGKQAQIAANLHFQLGECLKTYADKLVEAGLGRYVVEKIRINRKNNHQAFIELNSDRETLERDAIIPLRSARLNAYDGDTVCAFVLYAKRKLSESQKQKRDIETETLTATLNQLQIDEENSVLDTSAEFLEDELLSAELDPVEVNCPKAFVVEIKEQNKSREIMGYVNLEKKKCLPHVGTETSYFRLKPLDKRFPLIYIPIDKEIPFPKVQRSNVEYVYGAVVLHIDDYGYHVGKFTALFGESGDMRVELQAILHHNGLNHVQPFDAEMNAQIAANLKPVEQQDGRLDLTKKCIFTIDPATARDLDDALSIEMISPGIFEVGVHISDVSYYLEENSDLDNIVKERCTSIYLVNEVIHMLPQVLCQHCSLLPNETKYTFSVFWKLKENGEIIDAPSFKRSIIRSCAQLSYEHAQAIIDNPEKDLLAEEFPQIHNNFTLANIKECILNLHHIAKILREKRYEAGALSIDNPKLRFTFCEDTLEPLAYEVETRASANFLIEEFMLLANQAVASFIYSIYPDMAILRGHAPPLLKCMRSLTERLSIYGINIDYSSSKALQKSMAKLCTEAKDPIPISTLLSAVLMKPMARAKYFCSFGMLDKDLRHYALSIPIYTHFTSPIRRYPDILVHRLLAAATRYARIPKRSSEELVTITQNCNVQHFNARNAGDEASLLFFKRYVQNRQMTMSCVIIEIAQHVMNVVVIETGHTLAINYRKQKVLIDTDDVPKSISIAERNSKLPPRRLTVTSTVAVRLVVWENQLTGYLVTPDQMQRQRNCIEEQLDANSSGSKKKRRRNVQNLKQEK